VTLDYAPVLDIHTNPANPIIGDRALAETAEAVAELGAAIVTGLQEHGIAACGKHFPGHGDTSVDSHLELPLVEHPPDRIRRVECVPFRSAIRAEVAFIMTAHLLVPSLDEEQPATLSPKIVQTILREELGYAGVILSDDLEMKAISRTYTIPDAAVRAVAAGCDGLLICSGDLEAQAAALEALVHAVEQDRIRFTRLEDALTRQRRAKERFLAQPVAVPARRTALRQIVGCDAHQRIADEMRRFA
jgi:beta-N-acetylhexosaminidase